MPGLAPERHFANYHRVLSGAVWTPRQASPRLLALLLHHFVPHGPIMLGLDDTLERRRGPQIRAKGLYRDPVRSSARRRIWSRVNSRCGYRAVSGQLSRHGTNRRGGRSTPRPPIRTS